MARRKNKQTRKYKPRNEFRYNNSPSGGGHKNFIFGETQNKYKSLSITSHPKSNYPYIKLCKNPQKGNNIDSYVETKPKTAKKSYYSKPLRGYEFSHEDRAIIRHLIKKYKKSTNRHKKKKVNNVGVKPRHEA